MSYALRADMSTRKLCLVAALAAFGGCGGGGHEAPPPRATVATAVPPGGAAAASGIPTEPTTIDPAVLERGKYVASVAGCATCHTPFDPQGNVDRSKLFGGGGVPGAPNISPDPATGIGTWTAEQIDAAVRKGRTPDGKLMSAMMPSAYYARMTDADARALVVFLRAQAPVSQKTPRAATLPPAPAQFTPIDAALLGDSTADPRTHGEYLATVMHCAACHTPTEGAHKGQPFAGGTGFDNPLAVGGGTIYAANITPDPRTGIGTWTEDDIMHAVREMVRPDGKPLRGPMTLYRDAWSKLTDADARAIATYLRSVPAFENTILKAQREKRLDEVAAKPAAPATRATPTVTTATSGATAKSDAGAQPVIVAGGKTSKP